MSLIPYPHRFRTWEDASKFVATGDLSLSVHPFIEEETPHGIRTRMNPEYKNAPYEYTIVKVENVFSAVVTKQ